MAERRTEGRQTEGKPRAEAGAGSPFSKGQHGPRVRGLRRFAPSPKGVGEVEGTGAGAAWGPLTNLIVQSNRVVRLLEVENNGIDSRDDPTAITTRQSRRRSIALTAK